MGRVRNTVNAQDWEESGMGERIFRLQGSQMFAPGIVGESATEQGWNRERQIRERLSQGGTFQLKNPFNPNPPVKMFIRAQLYALSDEVEGALDRGCLCVGQCKLALEEQQQGNQTIPY